MITSSYFFIFFIIFLTCLRTGVSLDTQVSLPEKTKKLNEKDEIFNNTIEDEYYTFEIKRDSTWIHRHKEQVDGIEATKLFRDTVKETYKVILSSPFMFYGHFIHSLMISRRGFLHMDHIGPEFSSMYIAPLMADFYFNLTNEPTSSVYYYKNTTVLIVWWENLRKNNALRDASFTFQVVYYTNGSIIFNYPHTVSDDDLEILNIQTKSKPTMIGLSEAAYLKSGTRKTGFVWKTKIVHTLSIPLNRLKDALSIVFKSLPSCLSLRTCQSCTGKKDRKLACSWCPALNLCSGRFNRFTQYWLDNKCDVDAFNENVKCTKVEDTNKQQYRQQQQQLLHQQHQRNQHKLKLQQQLILQQQLNTHNNIDFPSTNPSNTIQPHHHHESTNNNKSIVKYKVVKLFELKSCILVFFHLLFFLLFKALLFFFLLFLIFVNFVLIWSIVVLIFPSSFLSQLFKKNFPFLTRFLQRKGVIPFRNLSESTVDGVDRELRPPPFAQAYPPADIELGGIGNSPATKLPLESDKDLSVEVQDDLRDEESGVGKETQQIDLATNDLLNSIPTQQPLRFGIPPQRQQFQSLPTPPQRQQPPSQPQQLQPLPTPLQRQQPQSLPTPSQQLQQLPTPSQQPQPLPTPSQQSKPLPTPSQQPQPLPTPSQQPQPLPTPLEQQKPQPLPTPSQQSKPLPTPSQQSKPLPTLLQRQQHQPLPTPLQRQQHQPLPTLPQLQQPQPLPTSPQQPQPLPTSPQQPQPLPTPPQQPQPLPIPPQQPQLRSQPQASMHQQIQQQLTQQLKRPL